MRCVNIEIEDNKISRTKKELEVDDLLLCLKEIYYV